eukprot:TRINITY_DN15069_c0_g1_i7.p1 TRINITY_DN15069_c0_g1~~TRINITY_DN15069_c0_g1_i7.p1  ORF type:complete len:131 (+),score=27.88 TRINITY_DN15069_c0_g1_i7:239-631(+)
MHAGCPVLGGEKWAVNLWVWNRPRIGETQTTLPPSKIRLSISWMGEGEGAVYWAPPEGEKKLNGVLGSGRNELTLQTYDTHRFELYVGEGEGVYVGEMVAKASEGLEQHWVCTSDDVRRVGSIGGGHLDL